MGSALVSGLIRSGWSAEDVAVIDPSDGCRSALARRHPSLGVHPAAAAGMAEGGDAILAVKPEAADAACRSIATAGARPRPIGRGGSGDRPPRGLVAGGDARRAGRAQHPSLVGAGVAAMSGGSHVRSEDLDWAEASCCVRSGPWCACPSATSTRSLACRARARRTCSWWPKRSSRPGCSRDCPATWPGRSSCRRFVALPRCWQRTAPTPPGCGSR